MLDEKTPAEVFWKYYSAALDGHPKLAEKIAKRFEHVLDAKTELSKAGKIDSQSLDVARVAYRMAKYYPHFNDKREAIDEPIRVVAQRLIANGKNAERIIRRESENDLKKYIMAGGMSKIDANLKIIHDEWKLTTGRADLLTVDAQGNKIPAELKGKYWKPNRNNSIELAGEANNYLNALNRHFPNEKHKVVLVLPEFSDRVYDDLWNRFQEGNAIAFTYVADGAEYKFSPVDLSIYAARAQEAAKSGFKPETWMKKQQPKRHFGPSDVLKIEDLVPKNLYKQKQTKDKPPVARKLDEKERELIVNYIGKVKALLAVPDTEAAVRNIENITEQAKIFNRELSDKCHESQYVNEITKKLMDNLSERAKIYSEYSDFVSAALYPTIPRILPDFESIYARIKDIYAKSNEMVQAAKICKDALENDLADLRAKSATSESSKDAVIILEKHMEERNKMQELLFASDKTYSYLRTTRIKRLQELKDAWPYENHTNWPLASFYSNLVRGLEKENVLRDTDELGVYDYDNEHLQRIINALDSMLEQKGSILYDKNEGFNKLPFAIPLQWTFAPHPRVKIQERDYRELSRLKNNSEIDQLSDILQDEDRYDMYMPVGAYTDTSDGKLLYRVDDGRMNFVKANTDARLFAEYGKLIDAYIKMSNSVQGHDSRSKWFPTPDFVGNTEELDEAKNYYSKWLETSNEIAWRAKKVCEAIEHANRRRKKITDNAMNYIAKCWNLARDRLHSSMWVDIFTKTKALKKTNYLIAYQYLSTVSSEYLGTSISMDSDLHHIEKEIYNTVISWLDAEKTPVTKIAVSEQKYLPKPQPQENPAQAFYESLMPYKYEKRLPDYVGTRIRNFAEDTAYLSPEDRAKVAKAIHDSGIYHKLVRMTDVPEIQIYDLFHDLTRDLRNGKMPKAETVRSYFKNVERAARE